ncbi:hypothetical protein C0995_002088 [Termitomyces sp. Mi166|nr:hypothetical protein C0995_002088 [Termitomyces sp. Mi166\
MYNEAEHGDAGENVFIGDGNGADPQVQFGSPTYWTYSSLQPFVKQIEGDGTAEHSHWNFCQCVSLTPLDAHTSEGCNFAVQVVPSSSAVLEDTQALEDFLDGLDDEVIASMAFNCLSFFSSLDAEMTTSAGIEENIASVKNTPTSISNILAPAGGNSSTVKEDLVSVERRDPAVLLEEFYIAES